MSSGTHDQNWYITAHGVTTAFDGPVVPDVNINECTSRYSGPSGASACGVAAGEERGAARLVEHDDLLQRGELAGHRVHRVGVLGRDHDRGDVGEVE